VSPDQRQLAGLEVMLTDLNRDGLRSASRVSPLF